MKDLEDELGVVLFKRGKNTITLTPEGELFYEEAREVLARADLAIRRMRGGLKGDVLRVGYVPSLVAGLMPRAIEKFQVTTPRVRLELSDLTPREKAEKAAAGLLDLVILPGRFGVGLEGLCLDRTGPIGRSLSAARVSPAGKTQKDPAVPVERPALARPTACPSPASPPRSLVMRRFSPSPAATVLKIGLPSAQPNVHAEKFSPMLRDESSRLDC